MPSFMTGVKDDSSQSGSYFDYEGGVVVNKAISEIDESDEVQKFVAHVWRLYKSDNRKGFKALFTPKAKAKLAELGEKTFNREWSALSSKDNAKINSYFSMNAGVVVNWEVGGIPRGLFLKKDSKNKLKVDVFAATSDDIAFHNRSLYFTYLPGQEKKAQIQKSFSLRDSDYTLSVKVESETPYVHIFKKEGERWEAKVSLRDNAVAKGRFDDSDARAGVVAIKFEKEHFTQDREHELLVLQSDFPMAYYPFELARDGNLILKKE